MGTRSRVERPSDAHTFPTPARHAKRSQSAVVSFQVPWRETKCGDAAHSSEGEGIITKESMLLSLWIAVLVTLLTTYIWRRRKRFLLFKELGIPGPEPSFFSGNTAEILSKMLSLVQSCVDTFMKVVAAKQTEAASMEVRELFQKLSMDIIARSAFGTETGIQQSRGGTAADTLLDLIQDRLGEYKNGWLMYFANCFPEFYYLWTFLFSRGKHSVMTPTDYIKNNLASLIEERRANKQAEREDLLQLMLNAEEEADSLIDVQQLTVGHEEEEVACASLESVPVIRKRRFMTTTEIQSNAVMFLVAGFETTGTTLSFTSYLLAKHPDIQERTRKEILSVIKDENWVQSTASLVLYTYDASKV
ncbi:hypothetical protein HPB51_006982 [Rhipicephalus microplus]|uniref:Cytochrome n=1 Tax=Rhipicephalus microplus TaxID=6941 RepID=A0A9J6ERA1_RHIMP|nr:hypothetical protein HPB51_006982 [Rhipicephalus microplus]